MKDPQAATERIGRYQLLEPIGAGPNGAVARAKVFGVAGFERQFAIKRFSPELTMLSAHAQVLSTAARAYGSLEHPRIARMSEFGVAQGQTFTAVEFVAGLDAMRMLAETKLGGTGLAIGGALAVISQTARAVGYAHGRGLSHLGLAPSNVIVTVDGDVKVTDFGILAATLTARPVDQPRLAHRIGYLAPEQLAGEATSAATDVFVLGVMAIELVTGQRAFVGDTPQAIADAILAGPPVEPPLPRPIVRVLQRCVARSPFERFPDARAFADALDAALRVAPVPGTRKDVGAQVKAVVERHAAMNDGNMSGVVALNLGTAPRPQIAALGRESHDSLPTSEFVRPDVPVAGPAALVGPTRFGDSPASTFPELPKPMTTVPGLAPPPIPVPQGLAPPATAPPPAGPPNTMLGIAAARRPVPQIPSVIPQVKPRPSGPPPRPPIVAVEVPDPHDPHGHNFEQPTLTGEALIAKAHDEPVAELDESDFERNITIPERGPTDQGPTPPPLSAPVHEIAPAQLQELDPAALESDVAAPSPAGARPSQPRISSTMPGIAPPRAGRSNARFSTHPLSRTRHWPALVVIVGVLAGLGWYLWSTMQGNPNPTSGDHVAAASGSGKHAVAVDGAAAVAIDAAVVVAVTAAPDAAAAKPALDAAVAKAAVVDAGLVQPTASSDALQIASTPPGARVFLDGADQGVTPVKLPGSADRHTVALLLAGHELYVAEVDGHGAFAIPLKPVTPAGGPAGIKVIKCKAKERYYVSVDGKPTGQTCPTERIECGVGPHTVEVYDIVTETRRTWDIRVTDTRLSYRVRVD